MSLLWLGPGPDLAADWPAVALDGLGWLFLAWLCWSCSSEVLVLAGPDCSAGLSTCWPARALALAGLHRLFHARPGWVSQGELVLSLLDPDLTGRDLALALVRTGSELVEPWT